MYRVPRLLARFLVRHGSAARPRKSAPALEPAPLWTCPWAFSRAGGAATNRATCTNRTKRGGGTPEKPFAPSYDAPHDGASVGDRRSAEERGRLMTEVVTHAERMRGVIKDAARGLVGRQRLVELVVLAAVAGEHVLIIGPPGTAKSAAVRRVSQRLGGGYFEYLLGRFTEPNEIFGPIDIAKLQDGRVETQTSGMLPEADVAFLDEVFLGSTAILNTLLSILNERRFRRGHTSVKCPLKVCVGASNAMPTDESLAAFADRFLVNLFVEPTGDSDLEDLLEAGWSVETSQSAEGSAIDSVEMLRKAVPSVDLSAARPVDRPSRENFARSRNHAHRPARREGSAIGRRRGALGRSSRGLTG